MKSPVRVPSSVPLSREVYYFHHPNVYQITSREEESRKEQQQQLLEQEKKEQQHPPHRQEVTWISPPKSKPLHRCTSEKEPFPTCLGASCKDLPFIIKCRQKLSLCTSSFFNINFKQQQQQTHRQQIHLPTYSIIQTIALLFALLISSVQCQLVSSASFSSPSPASTGVTVDADASVAAVDSSLESSLPPAIPTPSAVIASDPMMPLQIPGTGDDSNYDPLAEDQQRDFVDPCCACEEAKYEVIFEGLWSKYTHPKDFPENVWLTHFSDIIGASHSPEFKMWDYNGYASDGLQQVAELGVTKKLEAELKAESSKIRTIIKARGLWYPNLNGKTFAVFRVDQRNHLMSLVSMLGPSPDWFVGVSSLELCMKNCSWVPEKVINLYLWDAGTDSGMSYLSPNQPTIPVDRIKKIRTYYPSSSESPFFDSNGGMKMKPFVKLTVTRQRIYEKSCDENANTIGGENRNQDSIDAATDDTRSECQTTAWSDWSACSATCGSGIRIRTRNYISTPKARGSNCAVTLVEKSPCETDCVGDVSCATTAWSEWSECPVTCGRGYRTRTRLFANHMARRVCSQVTLVETEPCVGIVTECSDTNLDTMDPRCIVTEWSEWSPCTSSCGNGEKARTRLYIKSDAQGVCNVELIQKATCFGSRPECNPNYFNYSIADSRVNKAGSNQISSTSFSFSSPTLPVSTNQVLSLQPPRTSSRSDSDSRPSSHGQVIDCVVTPWGPWSECSRTCGKGHKSRMREIKVYPENGGRGCPNKLIQRRRCKENPPCHRNGNKNNNKNKFGNKSGPVASPGGIPYSLSLKAPVPVIFLDEENTNVDSSLPVDCVVGEWEEWSPCSVSCGSFGIKYRLRKILTEAANGGADCPTTVERDYCTNLPPCYPQV